jgi:hypothetical protein
MRIIKLSQEAEFETIFKVLEFFGGLPRANPPGKFRVPKGWIAGDALSADEYLVFTFETRPVFTAIAASGIQKNEDEHRDSCPVFFQIDLDSLKTVAASDATACCMVSRRVKAGTN